MTLRDLVGELPSGYGAFVSMGALFWIALGRVRAQAQRERREIKAEFETREQETRSRIESAVTGMEGKFDRMEARCARLERAFERLRQEMQHAAFDLLIGAVPLSIADRLRKAASRPL